MTRTATITPITSPRPAEQETARSLSRDVDAGAQVTSLSRLECLPLAGGAALHICQTGDHQSLTLTSREGRALFEYDTESGCLRISGPITNVSLDSSAADLELRSAGQLSLSAKNGVNIRSERGVSLDIGEHGGPPSTTLQLAPHGVTLASRQLALAAETARMSFQRAELRGTELRAIWSKASLVSDRVELEARQLRSRLQTVVQEVQDSFTLKAGRVRQWIRGSHHTRAESCELLANKDVRIDGKVINLG